MLHLWNNEWQERGCGVGQTHTSEEQNTLERDELVAIILAVQGHINTLNGNVERLIE